MRISSKLKCYKTPYCTLTVLEFGSEFIWKGWLAIPPSGGIPLALQDMPRDAWQVPKSYALTYTLPPQLPGYLIYSSPFFSLSLTQNVLDLMILSV